MQSKSPAGTGAHGGYRGRGGTDAGGFGTGAHGGGSGNTGAGGGNTGMGGTGADGGAGPDLLELLGRCNRVRDSLCM